MSSNLLLFFISLLPTLSLAIPTPTTPSTLLPLFHRQQSLPIGTPTTVGAPSANGIYLDQNPIYFYTDLPAPPPNMADSGTLGPWAIPRNWTTACAFTIPSLCAQFAPPPNPQPATEKWVSNDNGLNCLAMYWLPSIYRGVPPTEESCTGILQAMVNAVGAEAGQGSTEINRASVNIATGGFPHGFVGVSGSSMGARVEEGFASWILQGFPDKDWD